ncbi:unnamed protein product, partial [Leptidea sinapis]
INNYHAFIGGTQIIVYTDRLQLLLVFCESFLLIFVLRRFVYFVFKNFVKSKETLIVTKWTK